MKNINIQHDSEHQMFLSQLKGGSARLSYSKPKERMIELTDTYVPKESRNKGVASSLVEYALDYADKKDYKVIPSCPFVKNFTEKHNEYNNIITADS